MTSKQFINHLFSKIWIYIIQEKSFQKFRENDDLNDYDDPEFYSDQIPELVTELKDEFLLYDSYKKIVGNIDESIRDVIVNFMAWFSAVENKTSRELYNQYHRGTIDLKSLNALISIVKKTNIPESVQKIDKTDELDVLFKVIDKFTSAAKPLVNRRKGKERIELTDEYDIQDVLHAILKPFFPTLRSEEVVPGKSTKQFLKIDFLFQSIKAAVECKYIRDEAHARKITKELNDDIQTYGNHNDCKNLVFFIYDKEMHIPDPDALEETYTKKQTFADKELNIFLKIRPKN